MHNMSFDDSIITSKSILPDGFTQLREVGAGDGKATLLSLYVVTSRSIQRRGYLT